MAGYKSTAFREAGARRMIFDALNALTDTADEAIGYGHSFQSELRTTNPVLWIRTARC
jgi:hypothetical protein